MTQHLEATDVSTGQRGIFHPSVHGTFFRTDFHQVHQLEGAGLAEYRLMGFQLLELVEWLVPDTVTP
ncbi:hypothetical protein GCM10009720_16530 [Yaniella flava]|uniref:Uncharacterized protein n=1 Tax=Yaniella flava TaxID=287930 RepID=A0ABP5FY59_9MICC|nr:hypothetical protein [Micrococcaceae bacterium]